MSGRKNNSVREGKKESDGGESDRSADRRAKWILGMQARGTKGNKKAPSRTYSGNNNDSNYKSSSARSRSGTSNNSAIGLARLYSSFSGRRRRHGDNDETYEYPNFRTSDYDSTQIGTAAGSTLDSRVTSDPPSDTYDTSPIRWGTRNGGTSFDDSRKLRVGSSLPFDMEQDVYHRPSDFHTDVFEPHSLSRQNGVRYSLKVPRKLSGSTISSESEASQEGCENALSPSSALLLPNGTLGIPGPGGRKHSVLFSSYDAWNEENMIQSFREMPRSIGGVLEAALKGDDETLMESFKEPEVTALFDKGHLHDVEERTPLHLAAAGGHPDTVSMLLEKGSKVNEFDNQKATPLACAASCGSLPVLEILLAHGADVNAGYDCGKTALHWAVLAGSVDCARKLLESGALQSSTSVFSETPLHVAATQGDEGCLQLLLEHGADTGLRKGPNQSTALHLAAEEGNAVCIKVLLKYMTSPDAKDARGHTALHVAATCDVDCVVALLNGGSNPNAADTNGRTPLHCAVSRGSRAAECVRLLLERGAAIEAQDNFGYGPLHLAAVNESSQCASILLSHGADVTAKTKAGTTALALLVRKIPDVMRYLVDRLDAAVTIHDHEAADPDCEIRLDFRGIVPNVERKSSGSKEQAYYHKPRRETEFLTCILASGNKKILAHPLSEAFLTLKWRRVRKFFWASLLFQIALVALFTIFVIEVYLIQCPYRRHHYVVEAIPESVNLPHPVDNMRGMRRQGTDTGDPSLFNETTLLNSTAVRWWKNLPSNSTNAKGNWTRGGRRAMTFNWWSVKPSNAKRNRTRNAETDRMISTTNDNNGASKFHYGSSNVENATPRSDEAESDAVVIEAEERCEVGLSLTVIWGLLVTLAGLMGVKEIFQLVQSPLSYIVSSENWGQWALIGSVTLTAYIPPGMHLSYWQYPAAAVGIFLAWGLMLLQVGRFPALGIYVQMLGKVAANFGLFILAYACLLIAFALAFCVLFPEYPAYSSVPLAILKVLTMMVGEVEYESLFYNEDNAGDPILYPITAHILHAAFVVIVTIVLMNLLVGLAVHDIQGLQKTAKLNRLSRQTTLISRLESFIFSKRLQACLPRTVGSILLKSALLVPSSYNWSFYFRPNDPRDQRLPKDLKLAALKVAATKHSSRTLRGHPDIRQHNSNNAYNSYAGSIAVADPQVHAAIRRIEQRMDTFQQSVEMGLQSLTERLDQLLKVTVPDSNKEGECPVTVT